MTGKKEVERLKLIYKNVDITESVDLFQCVHDMYAEGQSDTLRLLIDDENRKWDTWGVGEGDEIQIISDDVDTGIMFVSDLQFTDGFLRLTASSIPISAYDRSSRTWNNVTFLNVAGDVAQRHGLGFKTYHVSDKKYIFLQQRNESDVAFLKKRCMLEGCAFLVFDKTLILYSEKEMEAVEPVKTITLSDQDDFKIQKKTEYGKCSFSAGKYEGAYQYGEGREYHPVEKFEVGSAIEANRFAANLLRAQNKKRQTGFKRINEIDRGLTPAGTVKIESAQARTWNGPAFIYHVRNDYINKKSKIFFRKGLIY